MVIAGEFLMINKMFINSLGINPSLNVLGPIFTLFTSDMCRNLEKKSIGYAEYTFFYASINSPNNKIVVSGSSIVILLRLSLSALVGV